MRFFLSSIVSLFFISNALAQFNINVGYEYSYSNPTVHNDIISQLNLNNNSLENYQEMKSLHGFHGVVIGARYRFQPVGVNADWHSKFQVNEFEGENSITGATEYRRHYYRLNSYSVGLEFFIKRFSFGASIDRNKIRIRSENTDRSDRHIIFEDSGFGSHFFIGINLIGNDNLTIAIQPFVQMPWTKFDLAPLDAQLDTGVSLEKFEEGFMSYGLRIVFQNGHFEH